MKVYIYSKMQQTTVYYIMVTHPFSMKRVMPIVRMHLTHKLSQYLVAIYIQRPA